MDWVQASKLLIFKFHHEDTKGKLGVELQQLKLTNGT